MTTVPLPTRRSVFVSAVTEWDGKSVNVGYLLLYRMFWFCVSASSLALGAGVVAMVSDDHRMFPFKDAAWMLAAVWGTFTASLGALAAFVSQDAKKERPPDL